MLDLKFIRENRDLVKEGMKNKNQKIDIDGLLTLDEERIRNEVQRRAERLAAAPLRPVNRYPVGGSTL